MLIVIAVISFLISHVESQRDVQSREVLTCNNRMTVPFRPTTWVRFARPMEAGDELTVEGNFPAPFGTSAFSLNMVPAMAFDHVSLHMRFDNNKIIYSSSGYKWNNNGETAPQSFAPGSRYKIIIRKQPNVWRITNGYTSTVLRYFEFRQPAWTPINYFMALETRDGLAYNMRVTVSMRCARPPKPSPPKPNPPKQPPKKKPNPPKKPGHGGHGGYGGSYSSY